MIYKNTRMNQSVSFIGDADTNIHGTFTLIFYRGGQVWFPRKDVYSFGNFRTVTFIPMWLDLEAL